jgi:hypothetical protein
MPKVILAVLAGGSHSAKAQATALVDQPRLSPSEYRRSDMIEESR